MTPERYQRICQLFDEALEHSSDERSVFLAQACGADVELRAEVEKFLLGMEPAEDYLARPAMDRAAEMLAHQQPNPSALGKQISHYQIISLLGVGGMGCVYLARDTRLQRNVALKLLPTQYMQEAERVSRFKTEAQAASALNHPNLLTIYDVGQAEGTHFMATEYVEGQTLRQLLEHGALPPPQVVEITLQICSALAAAHEAGIIHRDIKPDNIMLHRDGYVKVLDFGLAKLTGRGGDKEMGRSGEEAPSFPQSPHPSLTTSGLVMGTASYMSPEQARGMRVDARTDVFSLGIVLFEMLEGRTPFPGANTFEVIAAILERAPVPMTTTPTVLQPIVQQALCKDRAERYQTIHDLRAALKACQRHLADEPRDKITAQTVSSPVSTAALVAPDTTSSGAIILGELRRYKFGVLAILIALGLVLVGGGYTAYRWLVRPATTAPAVTAKITPLTSFPGLESKQSFAPDGKQIAFVWSGEQNENSEIYLKQTDGEGLLRLTNNPAVDSDPVWSPDGRHIAFTRYTEEGGGVYMIPALGGVERKLTTFSPSRPTLLVGPELSWSPDGMQLAFGDRPSAQAPLEITLLHLVTGERHALTQPPPGGVGDFLPTFSPDGQTLAFVRIAARYDDSEICLVPVTGGVPQQLTKNKRYINSLAWLEGNQGLLYSYGGGLAIGVWQINTRNGNERRITSPEAIVAGAAVDWQSGRLSYIKGTYDSNVMRMGLNGRTSDGKPPITLLGGTTPDSFQRYSPDGKKLVQSSVRSGQRELWLCDSNGQNAVQLTNSQGRANASPNWSPDGRQIVYQLAQNERADLYVLPVEGGQQMRLTDDGFSNVTPSWSRDGKWIYYSSDRTGAPQIWKLPATGGAPMQVTKQGGIDPMESWDGKFVVYAKGRQVPGLWRVDLATGAETLITDIHKAGYWRMWDVTKDGIFFATSESPLRSMIEYYDFATGKVTLVTKLKRTITVGAGNISVSPDGRWLTFLEELVGGDLVLVENWR